MVGAHDLQNAHLDENSWNVNTPAADPVPQYVIIAKSRNLAFYLKSRNLCRCDISRIGGTYGIWQKVRQSSQIEVPCSFSQVPMSPLLPNRNSDLRGKLRDLGLLTRGQEAALPHFFILGTEESGAGEVARWLEQHTACSLPDTLGTQFFSSRSQWCDFDWYLRSFGEDLDSVRGEWTPTYALLPTRTIRLIHELLPDLKLVLILDDPARSLWHAAQVATPMNGDWQWAPADSLGQLERWVSVFPADQFLVLFRDELLEQPHVVQRRIQRFLDVAPVAEVRETLDLDSAEIPASEFAACRLGCAERTRQLAARLQDCFQAVDAVDCKIPPAWLEPPVAVADTAWLTTVAEATRCMTAGLDDVALSHAVRHFDAHALPVWLEDFGEYRLFLEGEEIAAVPRSAGQQELAAAVRSARRAPDLTTMRSHILKNFAGDGQLLQFLPRLGDTTPHLEIAGYRDYNLVSCHDLYLAAPQGLGELDLSLQSDAEFKRLVAQRVLLRARGLAELKQAINSHLNEAIELELVSLGMDGSEVYRASPDTGLLVGTGATAWPAVFVAVPRSRETLHSNRVTRAILREWQRKGLCSVVVPEPTQAAKRA